MLNLKINDKINVYIPAIKRKKQNVNRKFGI
jgi:hypothetical protein